MIPKFHIGQKVVVVEDSIFFKKGDVFTIDGVGKGNCKCPYFVYSIGLSSPCQLICSTCLTPILPGAIWFDEPYFAPVIEEKDFVAITFEKVLEEQLSSVN